MYKLIKDFFNQFKRCSKGHAVFHINGVSVQATTNGDKLNNLKIILITGKPIYSKYKTELEIDSNVDFPISILNNKRFREGSFDTSFISEEFGL